MTVAVIVLAAAAIIRPDLQCAECMDPNRPAITWCDDAAEEDRNPVTTILSDGSWRIDGLGCSL
jgi:hypothetical protein